MNDPDAGAGNDWQPTGLQLALAAISIPVGILVLSWFVPFMRPRWESSSIPFLSLIGGLVPALIGVGVSIADWRRRSPGAMTGLVVGLAAVPACLVISWWLAMQGIASHPV